MLAERAFVAEAEYGEITVPKKSQLPFEFERRRAILKPVEAIEAQLPGGWLYH
jgi:hypothetical protein